MIKHLLLFCLMLPFLTFGQVSILGSVIGQTDTKSVAGASVFINNATIGCATTADGTFTLKNVKPGKYELVISAIGFEAYSQVITVTNRDINLDVITLSPKAIALNEVKISYKSDPDRVRYYDWFEREFLGEGDLERDCKIRNPEILDFNFDGKNGILRASAPDFLIVENNALGYNLKYLLKDFTIIYGEYSVSSVNYSGSVMFEEMKGSATLQKEWKKRRMEVYAGSLAHFLKSATTGKITQNGFRALLLPANPARLADSVIVAKIELFSSSKKTAGHADSLRYWQKKEAMPKLMNRLNHIPLTAAEIISGPNSEGFYALNAGNGALYIVYSENRSFNKTNADRAQDGRDPNATLVYFNEHNVFFDANGTLVNPTDLTFSGAWAGKRIASLLPTDYDPSLDRFAHEEADSAFTNSLEDKLADYAASHFTEQAYLQFDKPYYATGDTMYFKAYVTAGGQHQLSALSGILNVELVNNNNIVISELKLQLNNGLAWGDFALPDSLAGGDYHIRAYTNIMRNYGEESFFYRDIPIVAMNTNVNADGISAKAKTPQAKPTISFFPEAGSLLNGIESKIAFKGVAADGLGIDVKGLVTDNENNQVAAFNSTHLGMGFFTLKPLSGKSYKAKVVFSDGSEDTVDLPVAVNNGYTLKIDAADDDVITVKVVSNYKDKASKAGLSLIAQSGGIIYTSAKINPNSKEFVAQFSKKAFPSGVLQLTLFSTDGEPLNERLLFVQNADQLKLNVNTSKATYATREKVKIELAAKNKQAMSAIGSFSVAVTAETKVPVDEATENGILANLLLTSEIKGNIENPGYYFGAENGKAGADLDILMLTQGYRRFEWKKILSNSYPPAKYLAGNKGMQLAGYVKKGKAGVPMAKIRLLSKSAGGMVLDTTTDANGRFVFDNLTFADTTKFIIQARTAGGQKEVDIEMDKTIDSMTKPVIRSLNIASNTGNLVAYLRSAKQFYDEQEKYRINKHVLMLKEVKVKDKKILNEFENSDNLNGKGHADQVITADWLEKSGYTNLYDAVRAKATNILFTPEHQLRSSRSVLPNEFMLIIVDGTPISEAGESGSINRSVLDNYQAGDIESVEIMLGAYGGAIYGSQAANGVVIVTTKRARKTNNYYREAPGVIVYTAKGFYKAREFYSPQYDNPHTNQKMADLRSTIYWNPNIITDKDGKASFSYFNADGKGTYRVVIEGIDAEGNLGRQVFRYKVE